jgi:deoxyribodipyrimidine photolyase-related protein
MIKSDQCLILILGDQLTSKISSLRRGDKSRDIVLMAEVMAEATYVQHHKKKFGLVFSAMRHFAVELRNLGWRVDYVKLEDADNTGNLADEVARALQRHSISDVVMTEAGEWRLREALSHIRSLEDDRFICSHAAFRNWASTRKELRMEFFYRDMRRQTKLLMDGDDPVGGRWNFDTENRKSAKADLFMKQPPRFEPDEVTREVLDLVKRKFPHNFGDLEPFWFAVTAQDAQIALTHFLDYSLPQFGETQDAMVEGQYFMHHCVLSPYINIGLLDPLAVCRAVERRYLDGLVPIEAAEGFIRQIIGWREYIRGIYWLKMPEYVQVNVLEAKRPLPDFYWTGETKMNCVAQVVKQTQREAYAHHIQRLMITGNFALLAGLDPAQVHEWYLAVYADAFEWVELPNTIGMALHADGGLLGSKPYAASGNYINKMSNYCKGCQYDVKKRIGADACPFNALYWDFIARHFARFSKNPRMGQTCHTYGKFSGADKLAITQQTNEFLGGLKSSGAWSKDS